MYDLLVSCTKDMGAAGVDPIFGQGLLDFSCVTQSSGGLRLPASAMTAQVQGIRGALYGASTASTTLKAYDAFDRDFEHQVLHKTLNVQPVFDPFDRALVQGAYGFVQFTAGNEIASAWMMAQAPGNLQFGLGAAYEGDSLLGMTGSGHFAIADGRSLGVRMKWMQPLDNFWTVQLSLARYQGTASAAYSGAVSDLALGQSNASVAFERRIAAGGSLRLQYACSSGNSGSFNSFGTHIELFGASSCRRTVGAQIRF